MGSCSKLLNAYTNKVEQIWLVLKGILNTHEYGKFVFSREVSLVAISSREISDFIKALDYALSHRFSFSFVNKNFMAK